GPKLGVAGILRMSYPRRRNPRLTRRLITGRALRPQPVRPPALYAALDLIRVATLAAQHRAAHLRELLVRAEAQGDELRGPQLAGAVAQVVGEDALETEALLQADDAVLHGERHEARRPDEEEQRDGDDDFPPGQRRRRIADRVDDARDQVQREQRDHDEVVEGEIAFVVGVILLRHHGSFFGVAAGRRRAGRRDAGAT